MVRYAAGGEGSGTRCEAFGALRAAATAHPAAVSAMLDADDSFGFRSILPASTFAASRGNEDGDGDVRVAQASAKLLADFLAAVGGGGAGTAAEDDPRSSSSSRLRRKTKKVGLFRPTPSPRCGTTSRPRSSPR